MAQFLCNDSDDIQVSGELLFDDGSAPAGCGSSRWASRGEISLGAVRFDNRSPRFRAYVGAGRPETFTPSVLRELAAEFVRYCTARALAHLSLGFSAEMEEGFSALFSSAAAEGATAGAYRFDKYMGEERRKGIVALETFVLRKGDIAGLDRGRLLGEATSYAKNLSNEPGNILNPLTFVEAATCLSVKEGLDCLIYDESEILGLGMNALWYVGKGSITPPRLIHLVYRPPAMARKKVVIVGKGVTFDSGGLCIKTRESIKTMKHDKSGACVMMGIMKAVAELRLPVEVHGIAGLAENMPDGGAYRPDDIITSMNGKTIEILNTDAEGRLTLADALTFASLLNPDVILDVATLTGAAIHALGKYTAALLCDDENLTLALQEASHKAGERLHRFAMDDDHLREGLKGVHADLRQSSLIAGGGTIIAGMFLKEFVDPSIPWAHLDIAATGWYDKEFGVYSKGASAYSLLTIVEYLSGL